MNSEWLPATINGVPVFVRPETLQDGGDGAIAPPEHIDNGMLRFPECLYSPSYAHAYEDGSVMRFNTKIGTKENIVLSQVQPKEEARK